VRMCVCDPPEQEGYRYNQFVGYLGACVYTPRDQVAFWLGMTNIFLWLFAQAPQIYANYKRRTVEALSCLFLFSWLLGDATNLIGCILTEQLPTQLYTAIYFIFIDAVMLSQYAYYTFCPKPKAPVEHALDLSNGSDEQLMNYANTERNDSERDLGKQSRHYSLVMLFGLGSFFYLSSLWSTSSWISLPGRVLLDANNDEKICGETPELSESAKMVGFVSAWLSGCLYFSARFPQIWTNYKRKATEGLSLAMFIFSTAANVFYTLSIVIPKSTFSDMDEFYESTFPYLLGSGGTIISTIPILYQFYFYRKEDSVAYYYIED